MHLYFPVGRCIDITSVNGSVYKYSFYFNQYDVDMLICSIIGAYNFSNTFLSRDSN